MKFTYSKSERELALKQLAKVFKQPRLAGEVPLKLLRAVRNVIQKFNLDGVNDESV